MLRAIAGAVVIDVVISHWLFVCTILLALFIALAKRRHELVLLADGAASHRPILDEYSAYLLDQMIAVVTASTLIAYIFYTISPETEQKFGTSWLGLTIPFPLYGIFRYLYLVHRREGGGSPADLLLNDRPAACLRDLLGRRGGADRLPPVCALTMPDFNVRSDAVNVEQIMEQIRAPHSREARRRLHRSADPANSQPSSSRNFWIRAVSGPNCSSSSGAPSRPTRRPNCPNYRVRGPDALRIDTAGRCGSSAGCCSRS